MKQYLDIVDKVLREGNLKHNRTGISAITLPNVVFSHEMSEGFPLLTTKFIPLRVIAVELEGFLRGICDKQWYQERKCHIWDEWANPKGVDAYIGNDIWLNEGLPGYVPLERKDIQKKNWDLGKFYAYQWRNFGGSYDQVKEIVKTLEINPNDRRMVVSAWNPIDIPEAALPSCHFAWGLVHVEGTLNLYWVQRSCDLMLGVPFNIASYGLLLLLLCEETGFTPGNLTGLLADCHIYENHIDGAKEQLKRSPLPLSEVKIKGNIPVFGGGEDRFDIFRWEHTDIELLRYQNYPKINFPIAV
jgi:thymidylate synthase